jgi:iron complex transport system substrate-binding protein
VYVVNPTRLADVFDLIGRLGGLTGRVPDASRLAAALDARVAAVRQRVAALRRPRVLYVLWPEPLIVPGRGTLLSELLSLAGAESVTANVGDGFPRYSVEAAIAASPELIILAGHGAGQAPTAGEPWERFTALPAIRSGRIRTVSGDLLHRYGPRVVDGLEQLARIVHPEAFARSTPG